MSTFDLAVVAAITVAFMGFGVVLAWGWSQTKDLPKPVPWPNR
jgi:hypothetical protein